jgi:FRG domain
VSLFVSDEKVNSLSRFVEHVERIRGEWPSSHHKELWFRGESLKYRELGSFLHPALYRARRGAEIKPIRDILTKECELYLDFKRCAVQLESQIAESENWAWDAYFLMRHHSAPTRLLDWSDGALISLHFAVERREDDDVSDAVVYVLEPDLLKDQLDALPETKKASENWKAYATAHRTEGCDADDVASAYLPANREELSEREIPAPPMVLEFPHLTRRVAAQRSRFIVFGTDPYWLSSRFGKSENFPIKEIIIDAQSRKRIRSQLRDCGITRSVIFPDLDGLGQEMCQIFWEWR